MEWSLDNILVVMLLLSLGAAGCGSMLAPRLSRRIPPGMVQWLQWTGGGLVILAGGTFLYALNQLLNLVNLDPEVLVDVAALVRARDLGMVGVPLGILVLILGRRLGDDAS